MSPLYRHLRSRGNTSDGTEMSGRQDFDRLGSESRWARRVMRKKVPERSPKGSLSCHIVVGTSADKGQACPAPPGARFWPTGYCPHVGLSIVGLASASWDLGRFAAPVSIPRITPRTKKTPTTANGRIEVPEDAAIHVDELGLQTNVFVMEESPSMSSLGRWCMTRGYSFREDAGESPKLIPPNGGFDHWRWNAMPRSSRPPWTSTVQRMMVRKGTTGQVLRQRTAPKGPRRRCSIHATS